MSTDNFPEARRWVDDYTKATGGAKAYIAHQLANAAPALLVALDRLTAELDRARADERNTIAADIENMPINLGDAGWQHLEDKADEASYPTEWVRRRRTRDDFTTATIEVAYQYGYRRAAKVARGGAS